MKHEFEQLPRSVWLTLDDLIEHDWEPLINLLPEGWHVNLTHKSAPIPLVDIRVDGKGRAVILDASPHHYRIHGNGATLGEAFESAFHQVRMLLEPKR